MNTARYLESAVGRIHSEISVDDLFNELAEDLPILASSRPNTPKEFSKEEERMLITMSKGGGKLSTFAISTLKSVLDLLGWTIAEEWSEKKTNCDKADTRAFRQFMKSHGISGDYSYGESRNFYLDDVEFLVNYFKDLKESKHDLPVGACYPDFIRVFPAITNAHFESDRKDHVCTNSWMIITKKYTVTAANGQQKTFQSGDDPNSMQMPTFWTWAYTQGLQSQAAALNPEEIRNQRVAKPTSTNAGICPVCERYVERRDDSKIMRHGWRDSVFFQMPPCFGWGWLPWEQSPAGAIAYLKEMETKELPMWQKRLRDLQTTPPERYWNRDKARMAQSYSRYEQARAAEQPDYYIRGEHEQWDALYSQQISECNGFIRELEELIPRFKKRIAGWRLQPFWWEKK